jgi:hypothetical protein
MIKNQTYTINNQFLDYNLLSSYISRFWDDIFSPLVLKGADKHLMIMAKVSFNEPKFDYAYRTLGYLRSVNYSDKELFTDYLAERLTYLNESYTSSPIDKINFSYIERDGLAPEDSRKLLQDVSDSKLMFHRFNNLELAITMVIEEYGAIRAITKYDTFTRYIVKNGPRYYEIDVSLDELVNKVTISGQSDLKWTDTLLPEGGFKREIGKSTKYFLDGVNVLNKQMLPAKPFKVLKADKNLGGAFVTMDIETIHQEGKLIPYLICAYNGTDKISSYGKDQNTLFTNFINQLLSNTFTPDNNVNVYAHNLSGFDGIFLLRHLLQFGKVEPLLFNNRLMCIKFKTVSGKTITFKDSYLLLPLSLRLLCVAFGISIPKSYFPFNLSDINYTGVFPQLEYWTDMTQAVYDSMKKEFKNRMWSFKDEATKYCELDCQCLHQVLTQFNELIFNNFSLNIHKPLTLPALAMRIYKAHYMPDNTIYRISGEVEQNIRQSYTGGAVDVYIPHNRISGFFNNIRATFKQLFYYDVNSLYPTVMAKLPMPIGKPIAFEGNIRQLEPNAYGIFYCNIVSPEYLKHPILQRKIKGKGTVAGLGTWLGWISSIEMDNAARYGYTFEIIKGYQFEKGNLYKEYVSKMFELRLQYSKSHPMNLIAKLLLNSLYGKFGMKIENTMVEIFNLNTDAGKLGLKTLLDSAPNSVKDFIEFDNNKYLFVKDTIAGVFNEDSYHGTDVNIAVASTITAGARIFMSAFKNNPLYNLYYSDTDSIVIDQALDPRLVGDALGLLKLEHTISKAVFLAPKVYGIVDVDGNETIKIKGVTDEMSSDIHINDLELLLIQDSSRVFNQQKWYKSLIKGEIIITDLLYNLKVTSNKREAIYVDNIFHNTEPFYYDEIIKNN